MRPGAVGALRQGFDYQDLFAWYHAVYALDPSRGVKGIAVEAEGAGNVDDVVVRREQGADEYYQVKYSVDGQHPIDAKWWMTPATPNGKSPLQRFWESWKKLARQGSQPHMGLFTNRTLDVTDPLLRLRDGRRGLLGPRLCLEKPGSKARERLREWATHVGDSEEALLEMLDHLDLLTDQGAWSGLRMHTADRMAAVGLRWDEDAIDMGIAAIHSWVTENHREIDRAAIEKEVVRRNLRSNQRRATLVVHGIDHDAWPDGGTVSLDWVDLFEGDDPKIRRQLRDPSHWNQRLLPQLKGAEQTIRGLGYTQVLVRGHMRLPAWFATGAVFPDTRGFCVMCEQRGERWRSDIEAKSFEVRAATEDLPAGKDLAVGLSVSRDLIEDVHAYVRAEHLPIQRLLHIAVPAHNNTAIPDAAAAKGWATRVRHLVATHVRETGARRVHLFIAGPQGAALLLGHFWNRVPTTQVYEDLNPGYAPAFLIPG